MMSFNITGFGKVSKNVCADPAITIGAKSLYSLLCCYRNNESNTCNPGIKRLSDELNAGQSTVKRWMKELKDAGIVSRSQHRHQSSITQILK
jgi:DNA-binding MarR family transcriptional regulator